ncbi:MAG TPA: tetratricopeptide repeat protein [Pyrinomonadaceae bacterium]|nr:tetratricopeptide repeat protein [Pyrinomonadaceae bacterium]
MKTECRTIAYRVSLLSLLITDQVLSSYPNNASLHYLKAQIFGYERNSGQAEVALRKTLELDPNYLTAYSALGALFINTNQQDRAIAEYQKIVERGPDNATAHNSDWNAR